jgi:hypothetical protein
MSHSFSFVHSINTVLTYSCFVCENTHTQIFFLKYLNQRLFDDGVSGKKPNIYYGHSSFPRLIISELL